MLQPLPFNHDVNDIKEAIGLPKEKIDEILNNQAVHMREFVRSVLEQKAIDPYVCRFVCYNFLSLIERFGLSVPGMLPSPNNVIESVVAMLTLPEEKVSCTVERIERNFIELLNASDGNKMKRAILLSAIGAHNTEIFKALDDMMGFNKNKDNAPTKNIH